MGNAGTPIPRSVPLPGGCTLELDALGLPASGQLTHAAEGFCRCTPDQYDEVYLHHLVRWQAEYADQLQIDKLAATAMVCRLLEKWQIALPDWFRPIVAQWGELLRNQPEK